MRDMDAKPHTAWIIPDSVREWVRFDGGDPDDQQQLRAKAHDHGDCPGAPVCRWCRAADALDTQAALNRAIARLDTECDDADIRLLQRLLERLARENRLM